MGLLPAVRALESGTRRVYPEVAAIAFHFHWSREECMGMSGRERRMWLDEIGRINREIAKGMKAARSKRAPRR